MADADELEDDLTAVYMAGLARGRDEAADEIIQLRKRVGEAEEHGRLTMRGEKHDAAYDTCPVCHGEFQEWKRQQALKDETPNGDKG